MKEIVLKIIDKCLNFHQQNIYKKYRNKYNIDVTFIFNGKDIIFYDEGEIIISKNSYIGTYSTLQTSTNYKIQIGEGCKISHNVRMYTQSANPDYDFSLPNIPNKYGNIIIGNYVWIGANVFINPGVEIGDNSVIGANSVVTKNIEPFAIYGGVPAKLIRYKKI